MAHRRLRTVVHPIDETYEGLLGRPVEVSYDQPACENGIVGVVTAQVGGGKSKFALTMCVSAGRASLVTAETGYVPVDHERMCRRQDRARGLGGHWRTNR